MPQMFPIPFTVIVVFISLCYLVSLARVYWHNNESFRDLKFKTKLDTNVTCNFTSTYW